MARNVHGLTGREQEVLELLKQGHSQIRIAEMLQVEVATIYQYTWVMRDKWQVDSTYALIAKALAITLTDEGAC